MAERNEKHPLNVPGTFYNDLTCIDCDLCREIAPMIFRRDEKDGGSYVWQQPRSTGELMLAREALEECPTETIGNDG